MSEPGPAPDPEQRPHPGDDAAEIDPKEVVADVADALHVVAEDARATELRIFGSRDFFRLWVAQAVTSLGDWLGFLAIAALAFRLGSSAPGASIGIVMAARIVPGFFFATGAGVLIDRMDRKQVMVVANFVRAGVVFTLPFVNSILGLVFASLVLELATLMFTPAKEASVPNLVPTGHLATANSLSLAAAYGTFPLGAALFAGLAALADGISRAAGDFDVSQEAVAFYVNGATYLLAALIISRITISRSHMRERGDDDRRIDLADVFREIKEGWQFIFINPVVRGVNIGLATGLIGGGMLIPLGPVFSEEILDAGTAGFGLFTLALGIGVALGIFCLSLLQHRIPMVEVFTTSVLVAGVSLLFAASMGTLLLAGLFVTALGVCAGSVYVLGFTLLHENVEDELRGRVFTGLYTLVRLCLLIAFAVGGPLTDLLDRLSGALIDRRIDVGVTTISLPGVRLTLWLAGLIMIAAGILAARSVRTVHDTGSGEAGASFGEAGG
jgi:MFS family permease